MELINKFKLLPLDIIKHIILFDGSIKWRNGVFIDQFEKDDPRYSLLLTIPRPFRYLNSFFNFHYIVFFPTPLFSNIKRYYHVYSRSGDEIYYFFDVENLLGTTMCIYTSSDYVYPVESVEIKRLFYNL
jgi:hypothetical protein